MTSISVKILGELAARIRLGADAITNNGMSLARTVSGRLFRIGDSMSGECVLTSEKDSASELSMSLDHKDLLDALRRTRPAAYEEIVKLADKFVAQPYRKQMRMLEQEVPQTLAGTI